MGLQTTQGYRGKLVDKLTGTILDQFADEDIKVSNNILELFDLGEIPGTYTQQITLPGTKKNNAFFEQYYDISVWEPDLFNTNQVVEAYLDFDGFYLVNGYLQLNKVNIIENKFVDSYDVTLFGIISNFSIDTRASFLTDISSLSAYNHTSSLANITSSWGGGLFNGDIVYPMIEYGNDSTDQPNFYYSQIDFLGIDDFESGVVVSDYKPAIRIKKVWDAIFNEFGYTYTGSFWEQSWLQNVYMPLNNEKQVPVYNPAIDTYYQAKLTNVSASATTLTAYVSQSFPVNSKEYDYNGAAILTGGSFTYTTPITTRLDVKLNLAFQVVSGSFGAGSGIPAFYINYMSGSTSVNQQTLARLNTYLGTIAQSRSSVVTETFNIKDYIVNTPELDPGTYTFQIYYIPQYFNNFQVKLNPDTTAQSSFEIYRLRQAADFKVLDVPANMPNGTAGVRVIDFIRAIQKKFNLIIYPDKQNPNQFVIETFNNWYKQGEIVNFNKYINVKDKIEFTPANQLGYKRIRFSDAEDTDYVTTLFKRTNNRVYGESNFYDSGSYYSQNELDVVSDAIGNGPLTLVPGSVYTGSVASNGGLGYNCTSYVAINPSGYITQTITYTQCDGTSQTRSIPPAFGSWYFCARDGAPITINYEDMGNPIYYNEIGDCTPTPTGSGGAGTINGGVPMWIPYYIADDKYTPARVLPRLYFYNGLRDTTPYWFEGYRTNSSTVDRYQQTKYPYFDNYSTGSLNGTSSVYPQLDSLSLLYNNEQAVWGTTPTGSLVSEYWDKYLQLLYNPRTRLVDATAVIPLADYFNLELNDIAEFRGNYYHLRAINDYNLTTGECNIQMLGPIIPDAVNAVRRYNVLSYNFTSIASPTGSLPGEKYLINLNGINVANVGKAGGSGTILVKKDDEIEFIISGSKYNEPGPAVRSSYTSSAYLNIYDGLTSNTVYNNTVDGVLSYKFIVPNKLNSYDVNASITPHFELGQYYIGGYIGYFETGSWRGTVIPATFTWTTGLGNPFWGQNGVIVGTFSDYTTNQSSPYTKLLSASNVSYSLGPANITNILETYANKNSFNSTTESVPLYGPWYIGTVDAYVNMKENRDIMLARVSGSVFGGYKVPTVNEVTGAFDPRFQYNAVGLYVGGPAGENFPKNVANIPWPIRNFGY